MLLSVFLPLLWVIGVRSDGSLLFGQPDADEVASSSSTASSLSMFEKYDADRDELLNLSEFTDLFHSVVNESALFEFMDFNKNGLLTANEVVVALKHMHDAPGIEEPVILAEKELMLELFGYEYDDEVDQKFFEYNAQMIMYEFDSDSDGKVSMTDWNDQYVVDAFLLFDTDDNQEVNIEEFLIAAHYFANDDLLTATGLTEEETFDQFSHLTVEALNLEAETLEFETTMTEFTDEMDVLIASEVSEFRRRLFFRRILAVTVAVAATVMVATGVVMAVVGSGGLALPAVFGSAAAASTAFNFVAGGFGMIGTAIAIGEKAYEHDMSIAHGCEWYANSEIPVVNKGNFEDDCNCLNECEGDCDTDDDCIGSLVCFQNPGNWEIPPGCSGTAHEKSHDYCWEPNRCTSIVYPELSSGQLLGECQGDCHEDSDCIGDLECYHRGVWVNRLPPGCVGSAEDWRHDFCWDERMNDDTRFVFELRLPSQWVAVLVVLCGALLTLLLCRLFYPRSKGKYAAVSKVSEDSDSEAAEVQPIKINESE